MRDEPKVAFARGYTVARTKRNNLRPERDHDHKDDDKNSSTNTNGNPLPVFTAFLINWFLFG